VAALDRSVFDVIITDLEMPQMRGEELVRLARGRQPDACILVVTGSVSGHVHGACHVFEKPFAYETITSTVARCRAGEGGCCFMQVAARYLVASNGS
jgi:DNA-binding NtrC family response regulator